MSAKPHRLERVLDVGCRWPPVAQAGEEVLVHRPYAVVRRHFVRADELRANCARLHAASVTVIVEAARIVTGQFDRVMLDAPCSNLGTLARRPDARGRKTPQQITELARLQEELLDAAARATKPGGTLVYSVCTISPAEGSDQVDRFARRHPEFTEKSRRQTLPHRDATDGFYIANLERAPA